ncbi:MAG: DUF4388 domain-containing protein [Desulfotalea sp.]
MGKTKNILQITEQKNCPLYECGEIFCLSGMSLAGPPNKEVCLILVRDLTQLLFKLHGGEIDLKGKVFNCGGCVGLIKFVAIENEATSSGTQSGVKVSMEDAILEKYGVNIKSAFLSSIPAEKREETLNDFSLIELTTGTTLIQKGVKNHNLYLIIDGQVVVENDGFVVARMGPGELFGEMSYLGADKAVSTVLAENDTKVLAIRGIDFGKKFDGVPSVQQFMAKMLASRLSRNNKEREQDLIACMSGRIDKISPAELLQIFHMNQKTGVLKLSLSAGQAYVVFRDGDIVASKFNGKKQGKESVFAILCCRTGNYRFHTGIPKEMEHQDVIGDFMGILMEGVQLIDEGE